MVIAPTIFNTPQWHTLSQSARLVYLLLSVRANQNGRCWPSLTSICADGKFKRNTVANAVKELDGIGFLTKETIPGIKSVYMLTSQPVSVEIPVSQGIPVPVEIPDQYPQGYRTSIPRDTWNISLTDKEHNHSKIASEIIDEIYRLYPTKDTNNQNRSTGKTSKNRDKIAAIIKAGTSPDKLKQIITRYLSDCAQSKTFLKNFGTFLNNLPDYDSENAGVSTTPLSPSNSEDDGWH